MEPQKLEPTTRRTDMSKRRERAHRILDAATELILRWGYNKTTIDDIAREAGVAKGTIYLHWKTREELFSALLRRERLILVQDITDGIANDPDGATLHSILKQIALAVTQRPLMKAMLLRDMDVLGKLAQGEQRTASYSERLVGFEVYLDLLRDHNLVRTDLSPRVLLYTFSAIFMGFFLVAPLMPANYALSDEEVAELMAETARRSLGPEHGPSASDLQTASSAFLHYLERATARLQEQIQQDEER